jgi:putative transcriptional regulator
MSRRELAELVGVNPQTIGFPERGECGPSLALALRIAPRVLPFIAGPESTG